MTNVNVINIKNFKPVLEQVSDDWIQCSVTGEYRPASEYMNDLEEFQSRTMCLASYMSSSDTNALNKIRLKEVYKSPEYKILLEKLYKDRNYLCNSVSIDEFIQSMILLRSANPNCRVAITESGYYSISSTAEIYNYPDLVYTTIDGLKVFSIGHSSQER